MKLRDTLQQLIKDIAEIKGDLKYHIYRTDLLEAEFNKESERLDDVHDHVVIVRAIFKYGLAALGALATLLAIYKYLS